MADNRQYDSMDNAMLELRERLRLVSERLRNSRRTPGETGIVIEKSDGPAEVHAAPPASHDDFIPTRLPADRWPAFLRKLSHKLSAVCGSTEGEFIAVGASLHDVRKRAGKISSISEDVARIITNRHIADNIDELKKIIAGMREWLYSPEAEAGMNRHQFNSRMLVDRTRICLNTLEKNYYKSEFVLKNFTDRSRGISMSIDAVIESLQYSDIMRQHLEHIQTEVDTLVARLTEIGFGSTVTDFGSVKEVIGEAGGTCVVLSSELRRAGNEFDRAMKSITGNLMAVSREASDMSEDIMQVVKGDSGSGKSFMSAIGNWLSSLTDTLSVFNGEGKGPGQEGLRAPSFCHGRDNTSDAVLDVPEKFGRMVEELGVIVNSLRTANGNILYRLSLIEDEGKALTAEIESVVKAFGVNANVISASEGIAGGLDKVAEEAGKIAPEEVAHYSASTKSLFHASYGPDGAGDRTHIEDNVELF